MALVGGGEVRELQFAAQFKPLNYRLEVHVGEVLAEDAADGGANECACDGVRAFEFAFVFEFHFSGDGGEGGVDVGDAGDDGLFAVASGALLGGADEAFERGDGKTLTDAGAAVHALVFARLEGDFFHDLAKIVGHVDFLAGIAAHPGFLRGDGHSFFEAGGIVRANLCADAVFQRSDDFSARGVILGIGSEDKEHVEREAQGIALNLNVAFLHDVEEADLNFSGEVGELIDGEDAAIGSRKKAVVDGEFVGEVAAAAGRPDGIDIADDVGHGYVGSGDFFAARAADGFQRIVIDFAASDDGHLRIEQVDEAAKNSAFGLAAEAEQNEIVAGEQGIDDLRDDGVLVAMHAGEKRLAFFNGTEQIAAELILYGAGYAAGIKIGNAL